MLADFPEVEPVPGRVEPPELGPARRALEKLLDLAHALVPAERPEKGRDGLQSVLVRCFRRRRNIGFDDGRRLMETIELFDKKLGVTKNRWAVHRRRTRRIGRIAARPPSRGRQVPGKDLKALAYSRRNHEAAAESFRETHAVPRSASGANSGTPGPWPSCARPSRFTPRGAATRAGSTSRTSSCSPRSSSARTRRSGVISASGSIPSSSTSSRTPIPSRPRSCSSSPGARTGARPDRAGLDHVQARAGISLPRRRPQAVDLPVPAGRHRHLQSGQGPDRRCRWRDPRAQRQLPLPGPIADWINPLFDPGREGLFPTKADAYQAGFMPLETMRGRGSEPLSGVRQITVPAVPAARQGAHRRLRFGPCGRVHRLGPGREPRARGRREADRDRPSRAISWSSSATRTV